MTALKLYHYTCEHGAQEIQRDRMLLRPISGLLWLTDLDVPVREALGLTSHILSCDRTQYRFEVVEPEKSERWMSYRRGRRQLADLLESSPGAMPMHWWISEVPVLAVRP